MPHSHSKHSPETLMDEIGCIKALAGLPNVTVNLSVSGLSLLGKQRACTLGGYHLLTIEWE